MILKVKKNVKIQIDGPGSLESPKFIDYLVLKTTICPQIIIRVFQVIPIAEKNGLVTTVAAEKGYSLKRLQDLGIVRFDGAPKTGGYVLNDNF